MTTQKIDDVYTNMREMLVTFALRDPAISRDRGLAGRGANKALLDESTTKHYYHQHIDARMGRAGVATCLCTTLYPHTFVSIVHCFRVYLGGFFTKGKRKEKPSEALICWHTTDRYGRFPACSSF